MSIQNVSDTELAAKLGRSDDQFVVVKRVRELADGTAISAETSWVPATGALRELPESGIRSLSLTEALASESLIADHGTQRMSCRPLTRQESADLKRPDGSWFLYMERTCNSVSNDFVEYVECLLDTAHFAFELDVSSGDL